jgi:hypothetical protein
MAYTPINVIMIGPYRFASYVSTCGMWTTIKPLSGLPTQVLGVECNTALVLGHKLLKESKTRV